MTDFDLTVEQSGVQELARAIGSDLLSPNARQAEIEKRVPDDVWRRLVETGLVAPVAIEHGGGGLPDALAHIIAAEELGWGDTAMAAASFWSGNAAVLIGLCGTSEQKGRHLPGFADPTRRFSVAYTEGYGRSPSEYATTIEQRDGTWRVTGIKVGVPFVSEAATAVVVGTDPTVGNRLRAAILPSGFPSDCIRSVESHIGLVATPLATVSLDVTVSDSEILGGPTGDPMLLSGAISRVRLINAALAVGCARRAREYAARYATEREAFGSPISAFQGVAFLLADSQMQIDAARLQVWESAVELEKLDHMPTEASVSMAVAYATSIAAAVTRDAVQVLGGHGFLADHPVERWYRAAAGLTTLDTDPLCAAFAPAL